MKDSIETGILQILEITVTEEMFAQFHGEVVHPVYSTASMVYHMECASRDLLLPYLETDEESAGASVSLTHSAPSPIGSKVVHEAKLVHLTPARVTTEVIARNAEGIIGKGEVVQAIMPKNTMKKRLAHQKA